MRNLLVPMAALLLACGSQPSSDDAPGGNAPAAQEDQTVKSKDINETLARHSEELMAHEGIQGIYVGQNDAGDPCLVILATIPASELAGTVPDSLEGWPVRIESGDEIRPMD
jgi:hypothetical protein